MSRNHRPPQENLILTDSLRETQHRFEPDQMNFTGNFRSVVEGGIRRSDGKQSARW